MYVCACKFRNPWRSEASGLLEPELQTLISHSMWVLGTKLTLLTTEPSFRPHYLLYLCMYYVTPAMAQKALKDKGGSFSLLNVTSRIFKTMFGTYWAFEK